MSVRRKHSLIYNAESVQFIPAGLAGNNKEGSAVRAPSTEHRAPITNHQPPRTSLGAERRRPDLLRHVPDRLAFSPTPRTKSAVTEVTWINRDDVPHVIVDTKGTFSSKVLDTNQQYAHRLTAAGRYDYFCSIHPKMTGTVVVT